VHHYFDSHGISEAILSVGQFLVRMT
jgi:hypothetical protein